ncbi:unnamed protein product [Peniophora sp. CBMAI 1063]|nr:unnamed protein product [Peniophora sp. CBMAI 1063]
MSSLASEELMRVIDSPWSSAERESSITLFMIIQLLYDLYLEARARREVSRAKRIAAREKPGRLARANRVIRLQTRHLLHSLRGALVPSRSMRGFSMDLKSEVDSIALQKLISRHDYDTYADFPEEKPYKFEG